jgi:hypothetical protein
MSRGSSVRIVMDYGLDGCGFSPSTGKAFLFYMASRPALRLTQPPIQWVLRELSTGIKRPGHEADHSLAPTVEVKNGGVLPTLPHMSSWHSA